MKSFVKWLVVIIAPLFVIAFSSCGDEDSTGNDASIVGKWGIEGVIDGDYVTSTMEFKKNGNVIIEEKFEDYPEDNYKITLNYSIVGDISDEATLTIIGKNADGEDYRQNYLATVSGKTLTLVFVGGEDNGTRLILDKK